ncbi:MAG: hypothetical protein K2W92_01790 [Alphaproteobacteria bacterium]|nr:hypothetical protein [Alphaproteobacteria bacterium]
MNSLRKAIGKLSGDKTGQSFEFTDEKGKKWKGTNVQNPEDVSLTNLSTGAVPHFTHTSPTVCHVSFDKPVDTPVKRIATILTLDLTQE